MRDLHAGAAHAPGDQRTLLRHDRDEQVGAGHVSHEHAHVWRAVVHSHCGRAGMHLQVTVGIGRNPHRSAVSAWV